MNDQHNIYLDTGDDRVNSGVGSNSQTIDFYHYIRIFRKNKWPIATFSALVTMLAAYYAHTATPIYESSATLLIESQKANILSIEEFYGVEQESGDYYGTQYEILKSRALAERVVDRLVQEGWLDLEEFSAEETAQAQITESISGTDLENGIEATGSGSLIDTILGVISNTFNRAIGNDSQIALGSESDQPVETVATTSTMPSQASAPLVSESDMIRNKAFLVGDFQSGLTVVPVKKTKLVDISYESADPEFAAVAANTVAEEYILSVLDGRLKMREEASAWMNERIAILKDKLDESERRLIQFKQENGLIDVNGSVGRLNEQELLLATTELAQAKSALSDAQDLYREVRSLRQSAPELLETLPAIQNDALVRSVKIEFGQRQREMDELQNRYGVRHPKIIDAQSRLDSLRNTLDGHIQRVVASIEKDFQLRRQRVASIQATLNRGKENIQVIGQKKYKLDALDREVATNRDIYNQFFSRIMETDSSDGLDAANARISDYAAAANLPIKPKKQIIIGLAMLASLLVSMLLAVLYEQLDDSVKGTDDVEKKLGVRLLGILPQIKKGLLGRKSNVPLNPLTIVDKKGTFVEAVNTARTSITIGGESDPQVILVTSSVPGEGKTSTSLNLAYSFSQLERVLLIDCDMRRPSVARTLGIVDDDTGLSSLITRSSKARESIKRQVLGSLDVLTAGPTPEHPLELLSSERFAAIMAELRKHYDRIILDSAPTQAVSDALVLSQMADTIVYAVKSHDTPLNLVRSGLARLKQTDTPVAGILMTQVDIDKISMYGGDYYYQGYYDYYGYTDKHGNRTKEKMKLSPRQLRELKADTEEDFMSLSAGAGVAVTTELPTDTEFDYQYDQDEYDLTQQIDTGPNGRTRRKASPAFQEDFDMR